MTEQFIQAEKARLSKDKKRLHEIMNSFYPTDMKAIGKELDNHNAAKWKKKASDVAYTACNAKFRSYPELGKILMDTHPLQLAEASKELPWGCGLTLKEEGVSDSKNWSGQGIMGMALERVRSELIIEFGSLRGVARSSQGPESVGTVPKIPSGLAGGASADPSDSSMDSD